MDFTEHPALRILIYLITSLLVALLIVGGAGLIALVTYWSLVRLGWADPGGWWTGLIAVSWLWLVVSGVVGAVVKWPRRS